MENTLIVLVYNCGTLQCKTLVRANLQLARWAAVGHLPSFEEYLDVAGIEIAVDFTLAGTLMATPNICKKEAYEWLESRDQLVRMLCTQTRLINDLFGFEVRKHFPVLFIL